MNPASYARVSTERQEQEETIQSQLFELQERAQADGAENCPVFTDEGYGRDELARPALDKLRDLAAAGEIDRVYIQSPDRLASGAKLVLLVQEFHDLGVDVVFLKGAVDDSPEGKLLLHMQGAIGEYEKTKIAERTRRGKLFWANQGSLVSGSHSYGYNFVKRNGSARATMEINEFEAGIVREMYRLLVDDRLSTRAIAKELNDRDIPTAQGGSHWHPTTVCRILQNPVYKGTFMYQRTRAVEPSFRRKVDRYNRRKTGRQPRPADEHIAVAVPPIVDEERWDEAQAQLARNSKNARRNNTRHRYLLRGLIKCPRCGANYTGAASRGKRRYRCSNQDAVVAGEHKKCSPGSLSADPVENAVWDLVSDVLRRPDFVESEFRRRLESTDASSGLELEEKRLQQGLKTVKRRKDRLTDAYQAEVLDLERFGEGMRKLDAQEKETSRQLLNIEKTRKREVDQADALRQLEVFCSRVSTGLDLLDWSGQRQLLELLVERIDLTPDDGIKVQMVIAPEAPTGDDSDVGELRHRHPEALEGCGPLKSSSLERHRTCN